MFAAALLFGVVLQIIFADAGRLEVHDPCMSKTGPGVCVRQDHCAELEMGYYEGIYKNEDVINCGYDVKKEIICCPIDKTEEGVRPYHQHNTFMKTTDYPTFPLKDHRHQKSQSSKMAVEKACQEITDGLLNQRQYSGPPLLWGYPVNYGEFPHAAAIGFSSHSSHDHRFLCSGSLIASRHVLTAASCLNNIHMKPSIVVLGITSLEDIEERRQATEITIKQVHLHPLYYLGSTKYDIAIIELNTDVPFNNHVYPICLNTNENIEKDCSDLSVSGWGSITTAGSERSGVLLKDQQHIVAAPECDDLLNISVKDTEDYICAEGSQSTDYSCFANSGGPLQWEVNRATKQYKLIGINLSGFGCGINKPGLYSRVSSHLDFISSIVWPHF